MISKYSVKLKTLIEEHKLQPLHTSKDYETALIKTTDVNRPRHAAHRLLQLL